MNQDQALAIADVVKDEAPKALLAAKTAIEAMQYVEADKQLHILVGYARAIEAKDFKDHCQVVRKLLQEQNTAQLKDAIIKLDTLFLDLLHYAHTTALDRRFETVEDELKEVKEQMKSVIDAVKRQETVVETLIENQRTMFTAVRNDINELITAVKEQITTLVGAVVGKNQMPQETVNQLMKTLEASKKSNDTTYKVLLGCCLIIIMMLVGLIFVGKALKFNLPLFDAFPK